MLGEVLDKVKYTNKVKRADFKPEGEYPIIDQSENFIAGYWDNEKDVFRIDKPLTIFGDHTRIFKYVDFDFVLGADGVKILSPISKYNPKFFYYLMLNIKIKSLGYSRHSKELVRISIPLPPLPVQKEIVAQIEAEQEIVNANKKLIEMYEKKIKDKIGEIWE